MSKWRETFKVHPAADVFPMMSGEELDALGADIEANGLKNPLVIWRNPESGDEWMIDGRNRFEAIERRGADLDTTMIWTVHCGSPEQWVATLNLHRRHMSKAERADAIVKLAKMRAEKKPGQAGPVHAKGGRGKKSAVKAEAAEINAALPKGAQVSERTIKRAMQNAEAKAAAKEKRKQEKEVREQAWAAHAAQVHADWKAKAPERAERLKICHRMIDAGYKALAKEMHPDAGGSAESMTKLNQARSYLRGRA
jgi:hypothetical protein